MIGRQYGVIRVRVGAQLRNETIWQSFWCLADQGLISVTTLTTVVLLARETSPQQFGLFSFLYSLLLIVNGPQSALFTQPHNVLAAELPSQDFARYTTGTAIAQLTFTAALTLLTLIAACAFWVMGMGTGDVLIAATAVLCFSQLQEFARRVLYTKGQAREAFQNDAVTYGARILLLAGLAWQNELTLLSTLVTLAGTMVAGTVYGLWQVRPSLSRTLSRRESIGAMRDNWRFGKWLLGSWLASTLSVQGFTLLATSLTSLTSVGAWRAAQTILGPSGIVQQAMVTYFPARMATVLARDGMVGMKHFMVRVSAATLPMMLIYCLVVAVFASPILGVIYGDEYREYWWVLSGLALVAALDYIITPLMAALNAMKATPTIFRSRVYEGLAVILVGAGAALVFGLPGVILGLLAGSLSMTWTIVCQYQRAAKAKRNDICRHVPVLEMPVSDRA